MLLYRGDSFFNKLTEPGLYRSEGIRSKSFGAGDPAYIKREGLINAIRKHVKHDHSIPEEKHYYDTTDFISFSEDRDRAMYWLSDRSEKILTPCSEPYMETRYLFILDIDTDSLEDFGNGIYHFCYSCNPKLKSPNAPDLMTSIVAQAMNNIGCGICNNGTNAHQLIIINSEQYLMKHNSDQALDDAVAFAHNDKEWLVLPADPINTNFMHARIPRSDIWDVEIFEDRQMRDPMHHASLGLVDGS